MATQDIKRRYGVHYYHAVVDRLDQVAMASAAATEVGAVRASVVRIFLNEYEKAVIYDRITGAPLYALRRSKSGIEVQYGSGSDYRPTQQRIREDTAALAVH